MKKYFDSFKTNYNVIIIQTNYSSAYFSLFLQFMNHLTISFIYFYNLFMFSFIVFGILSAPAIVARELK